LANQPIAVDLDLDFGRQTWSFTAYGLTFAGFLLFAGRLSDLVSASWVFVGSFSGMAILNLAMSFSQDKYVFIALRALCGICGAASETRPPLHLLIAV
jgi:MFS family permease